MIVAEVVGASACARRRRASSSATSVPGVGQRRRAPPASICQTCVERRAGRRGPRLDRGRVRRRSRRRTATAPESLRIHCDLLGRGGLVDRHGDRAGGPDREVEQRPLVAGARHQADPVARLDAGGDQALGERRAPRRGTRGGDVVPAVAGPAAERRPCAVPARRCRRPCRSGCRSARSTSSGRGVLVHRWLLLAR